MATEPDPTEPKSTDSWATKIWKWHKENKLEYDAKYVNSVMQKSEPDAQKSVRQYQWQITFRNLVAGFLMSYNIHQILMYFIEMGIKINWPPFIV